MRVVDHRSRITLSFRAALVLVVDKGTGSVVVPSMGLVGRRLEVGSTLGVRSRLASWRRSTRITATGTAYSDASSLSAVSAPSFNVVNRPVQISMSSVCE